MPSHIAEQRDEIWPLIREVTVPSRVDKSRSRISCDGNVHKDVRAVRCHVVCCVNAALSDTCKSTLSQLRAQRVIKIQPTPILNLNCRAILKSSVGARKLDNGHIMSKVVLRTARTEKMALPLHWNILHIVKFVATRNSS